MKSLPSVFWMILIVSFLMPAQPAWAKTIRIGSISDDPVAELKTFQPIADYLAGQLHTEGIDRGTVIVASSMEQMASFLREGKVDIYVDSPFPTLVINKLSHSRLLLRRWKRGVAEYHSVIFVRKDSGVRRIEDLRGKVLAFEEPFSTSAYFLPKTSLIAVREKLTEVASFRAKVKPGEIGYVFSDDDENTMVWVLRGRVAAGAMSRANFRELAKKQLGDLQVIHVTGSVPRHVVNYRSDLDPTLVQRIKAILLHMHELEEGRKVLQDFEKTTKFDEFPSGPDKALAPIRDIEAELASDLGS